MELTTVLWTAALLGLIGLVCGTALALIARKFGVVENEQVVAATEALPGINCGGCGYAGCADYAKALIERDAPVNLCAPGGAAVAARLGVLTGRVAEATEPRMAVIRCTGDLTDSKRHFAYNGITDCIAAQALNGGDKQCPYGCLGYGSCARVCPVSAIVVENGLARVLRDKCIACGACVKVCPRTLIKLVPQSHTLHVLCSSKDKGPIVKKYCATGCIGCRICTKLDAGGAFGMDGFLAVVDYTKPAATNPQLVEKCPGHCIRQA
jgi:electron transport complex protein RnfB